MKIPLRIDHKISQGEQTLRIYSNGKAHHISNPSFAYCYSYTAPQYSDIRYSRVDVKPLYNRHTTAPIYKWEFPTHYMMNEYKPDDAMESNISAIRRFLIDHDDVTMSYPNTNDLVIMAIDFEMDTHNIGFPQAWRDAIIATGIGIMGENEEEDIREIYMLDDLKKEREHLMMICRRIAEIDPDIICTYNGTDFDFPYFITRCEHFKIPLNIISRDDKPIQVYYKEEGDSSYPDRINIPGRVHYDVQKRSVKDIKANKIKDQKIYDEGLKSFTLKDVAKAYKCKNVIQEPPELMSNLRSIMNTQQMHDYLDSDIRCTLHLTRVYLEALIGMAEMLEVDLNSFINSSPSFISDILFSRYLNRRGYISDMNVKEYLDEYFPYLTEMTTDKKGNKVYKNKPAGAYVNTPGPGIYRKGIFDFDVGGQYPNILLLLNISPETVTLVELRNEIEDFSCINDKENEILILSIPDPSLNKQLVIHINQKEKGCLVEYIEECISRRKELRKQMKIIESQDKNYKSNSEWKTFDINQNALKVIINSITGYLGNKFARWGNMAAYMAITGTGRYIMQSLERNVEAYGTVIEVNTDCLYVPYETVINYIGDVKL